MKVISLFKKEKKKEVMLFFLTSYVEKRFSENRFERRMDLLPPPFHFPLYSPLLPSPAFYKKA
jgi:hypothetical protein